ncbi:MAG: FAD-dependent oxidoreductase, partial [Clostridia bacterium]|nr:FAD-dependent oxidoreductase [Clostridia bacterium]
GRQISYDKLLIATGSTPFVPPFKGLDVVNKVHTFYTLNDALELEKALAPHKKMLIVGGGLIGLKCAEGVYGKVKQITVVDKSHKLLSSILDDEGSQTVKELMESKGIRLKLSADLTQFDESCAQFADGSREEFDILVIAIGVRSNAAPAKASGLNVNQGVIIDAHMRTSDENIYSAGDCAEGYDMLLEKQRVLALLPNAYMQGETAGRNMAGKNEEYLTGIPMNAIGLFGLHMVSAGVYEGESVTKKAASSYKRLFFDDNRLKGFIIIGDCGRAGIYTSLIREKIPLSEIDFRLITDRPQLIALNKKLLTKKLGGRI